jgi:hypothetical protein
MGSPATKLAWVDLTLGCVYGEERRVVQVWSLPFWQFLCRLRHAKAIRLKVPTIENITVDEDDAQQEHLVTFPALERLELEGTFDPGRRDVAAAAIANLLQCCPVVKDLRIQITRDPSWCYRNSLSLAHKSREAPLSGFDASMDLFRRRYAKEMVPLMLDGDDGASQVKELPGLSGCWFSCLENHLKNVTLQFELNELESFEVCLAKFFAENCKVLDVLQIDDGNLNFLSHINWTVRRWRANALEQRKQIGQESPDSSKCKHGGKRKHQYDLQRKVKSKS